MLIQYKIQFDSNGVTITQIVEPSGSTESVDTSTAGGTIIARRLGSSFQDNPGGGGNPPTGPGTGGNPPTGPGTGGNPPTGPGTGSPSGRVTAIILGPLIITDGGDGANSGGGGNPPTGPGTGGNPPTGPGTGGNPPTGPGTGGNLRV